jgi:acetyl esterase
MMQQESSKSWDERRAAAGSLLAKALFHSGSALARLAPLSRRCQAAVTSTRNIPYLLSGQREHWLDVVHPRDAIGPLPVLFYVHGGGFRILSKETHWMMACSFARMGLLVVSINYRLAPRDPYPAALEDTCAAYRWTLENIADFGGDVERILVAGESAGANLVTALTLATAYRRPEPFAQGLLGHLPRAVLPACGLLQVSQCGRYCDSTQIRSTLVRDRIRIVCEDYLPQSAGDREDDFGLADPLVILESSCEFEHPLPPFLAVVGGKDPLRDDTLRLEAALRKRGVQAEAKIYAGETHAFHAALWRPAARRCWQDQEEFVRSIVKQGTSARAAG